SLVPSTSSPTLAPSVGKAFVVGPGYAPIPWKLVAKITSGAFNELADLLAENIRAQESEPHTYLDGKLLVAPAKKRVVEITDILTWIQAFTIYQWIFCSTYPSRWQETTQYKLLILQTASQSPGAAWLNYDTAFRKDAAASLLADWSKMNLDLYNFHTLPPHSTSLPHTSASSNVPPERSFDPIQYCRSWNDGACRWSLGQCCYRHACERCDAMVEVLWSGTSRDSNLMVLLRHLSLLAARHTFVFTARHVPGKSNAIANAISRFEFQRFHQLAPYASPTATSVPPWVLDQLPFIDFCTLNGYVSSNGSLLPTSEQTLLRFCSHLADRLHHSSIKVYLSAVRSLHIDQGFPDPL
ncbi:unnamed protein product, partial [Porites lobata]